MENNLQARRVIYIVNRLFMGQQLTVNALHKHFVREYPELTKRTLQRDMKLIQEIIPFLEDNRQGREINWKIPRKLIFGARSKYLSTSEILSLYFLKTYLRLFKGTVIEEQVDILTKKIEEMAPDDIVPAETIFADKNFGFYDYSNYDPIIRKIIRLIQQKQLVDIEYINHSQNTEKTLEAVFQMIFTYSEMLYTVIYIPKYDSHVALSIQNITDIQETGKKLTNLPKFNFNEWSKERFGVFWGDLSEVEIEVQSEFSHYFLNRNWHPSQKIAERADGSLILRMTVPITPDFTGWIMSWGDAVKVIKPRELIVKLKRKYESALEQYE